MSQFFSSIEPFLASEPTVLIVGSERALCLEAFQDILNQKKSDVVYRVACLEADPTYQPPGMPRLTEGLGRGMEILATKDVLHLRDILGGFTRTDPYSICSTVVDKVTIDIMTQIRCVGKAVDSVSIFEAHTPQELIQKLHEWLSDYGENLPKIWAHNTLILEICKDKELPQIYRLKDQNGFVLEKLN